MRALIRFLFRSLLFLLFCLVILLVVVIFFKIPVDLSRLKAPIERVASNALNRPVVIEDSIMISTSLPPVFTLKGLRIDNPDTFTEKTFLYLDHAVIQLDLLPLLKRKIHVTEIRVSQLDVTLDERANGEVNWVFAQDETGVPAEAPPQEVSPESNEAKPEERRQLEGDALLVRKLQLDDINVKYVNEEQGETTEFKLEKCYGTMLQGEEMKIEAYGALDNFPYELDVTISSLDDFLLQNRSVLQVMLTMAGTRFSFKGDVNLAEAHQELLLEAAVSGENLSSLDDLLLLNLPPFSNYQIAARLSLKQGLADLQNLTIQTGRSSLNGTARIEKADKLHADFILDAPLIQLDDFFFDNWSWRQEATGKESAEESEEPAEEKELQKLLDPELLAQIDVRLSVQAGGVLSGEDELGKGELQASLTSGRLSVEKLDLSIPGGSITMSASIKPGEGNSAASLDAEMENFDIGILARRRNPEATMGGLVNLDVDLSSEANSIDTLLANGNGNFDFSGNLENLKAGIIDLWAVNLVAAIVSNSSKNTSRINCAVGKWTVNDGLLSPDVFFIDTDKIRICGKGRVSFKKQRIDIEVAPTPKRPEFFNLATPVKIRGSFDDINVGIGGAAGVLGTAVKFIVSPVVVPIKRMVKDNIPSDGRDACSIKLGGESREKIQVMGCK